MDYDDARHLLNRTGFGATDAEVRAFAALSREQAIERLLVSARTLPASDPPAWTAKTGPIPRPKRMSQAQREALLREIVAQSLELRGWWLREMLDTPSPLTERMVLFWHNHFVSSQQKVKLPVLMYRQNATFRRHALGRFSELLPEASKEPAMIIYLDSVTNRSGQPNENFAREVMELFTLGEGHYTEQDVKEAARAFTGWSLDPDTGAFKFRPFVHDDGVKTVLGKSGRLDGDAVLTILLAGRETAEFVTAKLWREFVSPEPDPKEVARVAAHFRESGYQIKVALRELLRSPAFWARENRASLIKSPVDLVIGTLRTFEVETGDLAPFAVLTAVLGQNLFAPPSVKGWPGGERWIDSTTLLQRKQFLERLFRAREMPNEQAMMQQLRGAGVGTRLGKLSPEARQRLLKALTDIHFDADRWLQQFEGRDSLTMQRLVLAMAPAGEIETGTGGMELIRQYTQDAVYQLR
jgi:uncharacterized protein (DUF1800 family)